MTKQKVEPYRGQKCMLVLNNYPLTAGSEIKSLILHVKDLKEEMRSRLKEADEALRWQLLFLNFATLFRKKASMVHSVFSV